MRRGIVEVSEWEARRWEARWLETADSDRSNPIELRLFDAPAAVLAWARTRAAVVVVERPVGDGTTASFSAGEEPPPWNTALAALDEEAMLSGRLAARPEGNAGTVRIEEIRD